MIGQRPAADVPRSTSARDRGSTARRVAPRTRSLLRSWPRTGSSPCAISERITVGEMPMMVTPWRSTSAQSRSGSGIVRRALVDHERRAEHQRPADRPRPHHPAHVGQPEERVVLLNVEEVRHVLRALDREAAVDVDRALGLAGGARGVDQHVRVFGLGQRRSRSPATGQARPHATRRRAPRAREPRWPTRRTTSVCWTFRRLGGRGVGGLLHRHDLAAPVEAVGRDKHLRAAVLQPCGHRIGAIAGEDGHVDRAELSAGQRRRDDLRDHRQIDADPVALADAKAGERVGGLVRERRAARRRCSGGPRRPRPPRSAPPSSRCVRWRACPARWRRS